MLSLVTRRAASALPRLPGATPAARAMSAGRATPESRAAAKVVRETWGRYWLGAIGVMGAGAAWVVYFESSHEHEHHAVENPSYRNIRNKPFPWTECPDCPYFDLECWRACRAAK